MATSLLDKLMDELRCFHCLCRIESPLMKCTAGHHFCGKCNKSPAKCPSCECPTKRDHLIERLCLTTIKCPFEKTGCSFTGKPAEVAVHRSSCSGSSKSCLDKNINSESLADSKDKVSKKEYIDNDPAKSLEEAIIAELQCPVCLMRLSPPMVECRNGHLICHRCLPHMERCPVCRDSTILSINSFLEVIFHTLELPCGNEHNGCEMRGNSSSIQNHERFCAYAMISCPLMTSHKCTWVGLELQVLDHCRSAHFEVLTVKPAYEKDPITDPPFDLLFIKGTLFRLGWVEREKDYMLVIHHLGNNSSLECYPAELTVYSSIWKDGQLSVPLHSFQLNSSAHIDESHHCMRLPKDLVLRCKGEIKYELWVHQ